MARSPKAMTEIRDRLSEGLSRERLRLELRRSARPFVVWLALVVLGLVGIGGLLSRLQVAWPWKDQYHVRLAVDDAKGVVPGNTEVRLAGVVVARVEGVQLQRDTPMLNVRIQGRYKPLYRDARLRLRPKTPLEDVYLNVESRGTPGGGEVPDNGVLAAERTHTPVYIGKVLDVFNADRRAREKQAIENMGRGLGDHGAQFRAALVELAPFLDAARRLSRENAIRVVQTRRLIHNFRLMTEELGRRDRQVTRLASAGSRALGELGAADRPLAEFIAQMPPMLRQMPRSFATLRGAADELDPAFDALRPVAAAMPSGLRALERLGPDLRAGSAALRRPMTRLGRLCRGSPRLRPERC